MQNQKIDISIVVVGYRAQSVLPACFRSVMQQEACSWELIYVENCPENSAITMIQETFPFVICVEAGGNVGFARGCNVGAQKASGEYVFFLNPDTELKTRDTLKNMRDYMQLHPDVGLAAPLFSDVNDHNEYGVIGKDIATHYSGYKEVGDVFQSLPGDIAWVCGAAMIMARAVFEKVGGFDQDYFLYSEDVDLCLRVRQAGFCIVQILKTNVMHRGSESTKSWGKSGMIDRTTLSDYLFTQKHYTSAQHQLIWQKRRRRYRLHVMLNVLINWRKCYRYIVQLRAITKNEAN